MIQMREKEKGETLSEREERRETERERQRERRKELDTRKRQ